MTLKSDPAGNELPKLIELPRYTVKGLAKNSGVGLAILVCFHDEKIQEERVMQFGQDQQSITGKLPIKESFLQLSF